MMRLTYNDASNLVPTVASSNELILILFFVAMTGVSGVGSGSDEQRPAARWQHLYLRTYCYTPSIIIELHAHLVVKAIQESWMFWRSDSRNE